jgi:hypothetical protein
MKNLLGHGLDVLLIENLLVDELDDGYITDVFHFHPALSSFGTG